MSTHRESAATKEVEVEPILFRARKLAHELGVSRSTLWRMVRRAELPPPLRISRGVVAWRSSTIKQLLVEREQAAQEGR